MYVVRQVCPAAAVCLSSVLPTRGTLQYVEINTPLQTAAALLNPFSQIFKKEVIKLNKKVSQSFPQYSSLPPL